ncbi:tail fiber protein [Edwardsiella tarda]|uniref:tail fiber protein n=1 Tax=Edwardsiella tarda TaxID=636 RepID=UPI001CF12922|nr:tail fiber protein [Edwardsiella tarda]UCQ55881.1 tail fiber protein [Edwardsiella tarda]
MISGVLLDPLGQPVAQAQITLTATTNSLRVLRGFSCSVPTDSAGRYTLALEAGSYAVSVAHQGRNFVYGAVTIDADSAPSSLNVLLQQQVMEQQVTPEVILYFRQIQQVVAEDMTTVQQLSEQANQAAAQAQGSQRAAVAAENAAAQSAQSAARSQQAASAAERVAGQSQRAAISSAEDARHSAQAAAQTAEQAATLAASQTVTQLSEAVRDEREQVADLHRQVEEAAERGEQQARQATAQANAAHASQQAASAAASAAEQSAHQAQGSQQEAATSAAQSQRSAQTAQYSQRSMAVAADKIVKSAQTLHSDQQHLNNLRKDVEYWQDNARVWANDAKTYAGRAAGSEFDARSSLLGTRDLRENILEIAAEIDESVRQAEAAASQAAERAASEAATLAAERAAAQASEQAAAQLTQIFSDDLAQTQQHQQAAAASEAAAQRAVKSAEEILEQEHARTNAVLQQANEAAENAEQYAHQAEISLEGAREAAENAQDSALLAQSAKQDTAQYVAEVQAHTRQVVLSAQQVKDDTDTSVQLAEEVAQLAQTTRSLVVKGQEHVERIERDLQLNEDKAPLASPAFTGHPTAPTPDKSAAGQEIATAAFVLAQIAQLINASPTALDTLQELAAALGNDPNFSSTVMTMIGQKLDKAQNGADIPDKARFLENIGIVEATTSRKGIVQLSDSVNSFSSTQAATPWAVTRAYDAATRAASTNQAGRVRLNDSISSTSTTQAATANAVKLAYDEATRAASTNQAGRVRLNDSISSTSTTQAATANAVKLAYDRASEALPVGTPCPWPSLNIPSGWIKCAGQSFSTSSYPDLARAYPNGRLPDLRGEFIRGYDDGRGVDSGRSILTAQGDAIRNITGTVTGISETFSYSGSGSGVFQRTSSGPGADGTPRSVDWSNAGTLDFDVSRVVPTANENRPRNVAFLYIVRAA